MHQDIARYRDSIAALCRDYGVARLEVFGSAARGDDFRAARSDVDFAVEFAQDGDRSPLEQFFGFASALEQLLGRPVDLVEARAVKNPFVIAAIDRSREIVYGSPVSGTSSRPPTRSRNLHPDSTGAPIRSPNRCRPLSSASSR